MTQHSRRTAANRSIHPNGRQAAKAGKTTHPRRAPSATDAHRRHVEEHPSDAMSAARLSKLESGKA